MNARNLTRRNFMQTISAGAAGLLLSSLAGCGRNSKDLPNIVFIMADDMGYGDVGCYGATKIRTPHMDALAEEGMRFTDAHTPSAVCTPTRYGVLTGRYCWRSKLKKEVLWSGYEALLINPQRMTVASMLKKNGYATAAVGKWHLGYGDREWTGDRYTRHDGKSGADYSKLLEPGPLALGFDFSFQVPASHDMEPYCFVENGYVVGELTEEKHPYHHQQREGLMIKGWEDKEIGPTLARKAVDFIDNHAGNNNPFFLYFTPVAPHRPNVVADFMKGKSDAGERGDHVQEFDWAVGEVLNALERHGMKDNTLVIVTSDNGARPVGRDGEEALEPLFGHKSCGDYRGYKADIWDGGHRVIFIARWPGKIKPGSVSDEIICLTDLMATCASITGTELPGNAGEDSFNILPALLAEKKEKPIREAVVHHSFDGMFSIRQGDWKLVEGRGSGGFSEPRRFTPGPGEPRGQLYNVEEDYAETKNLYNENPEVVARLTALLEKYRTQGHSRPY